jgi:chromosome segregation ATPase
MTTRIPRSGTAISPPHSANAAEAPSPVHGNAAKATNFLQAARALLNAEVQDYVAICDENTDLVARNKTLEEDVLSGNRRIASLQNQLDDAVRKFGTTETELKKLLKEKEALAGQLTKAQETIREMRTEILRRDAESAKEAQTLRKQLDDERAKLGELQDFSIEVMPVAKHHKQMWATLKPSPPSVRDTNMTTRQRRETQRDVLLG